MVKKKDTRAIEKYVRRNVTEGSACRYIHFTICHDVHWTLIVYDTDDRSWKHYNSMRQRSVRTDMHYTEAIILKKCVANIMKESLCAFGMDERSIETDFSYPLEAVTQCPQQKAGSLDCGIIVCAIMWQYVHHCDVNRSMQGTNYSMLHANMVKSFVNDLIRGVKE
ncbi:hypothetical protein CsSME_00039641 [Camellia sinensis var. sinensis]